MVAVVLGGLDGAQRLAREHGHDGKRPLTAPNGRFDADAVET